MVDAYKGFVQSVGNSLCRIEPYQQSPLPAQGPRVTAMRSICLRLTPAVSSDWCDDVVDALNMGASGQFRNHAAIFSVDLNLIEDHVGKQIVPVLKNSGCRFIAGCFYAQDQHRLLLTSF